MNEKDKTWPEVLVAEAYNKRSKLLHNNKEFINEDAYRSWEQGLISDSQMAYKLTSPIIRETYMHLTIIIYENEALLARQKVRDLRVFNYSC